MSDILDNMGSDELAANIFRISQTKQKIVNENIQGEDNAKKAHYQVGKKLEKLLKNLVELCQKNFLLQKRV